MKFLADGPSIPDELLIARDEGRVIFFCGAGVSRSRAGLLDFFELSEQVVEALGVTADDPVRVLIDKAKVLESETKIPGLISADRVFGLLERAFLTRDIEATVASALKPNVDVDLSAHRIMLDLSRSPEGTIRLVTTNFDLLFETCDSSLPKHRNPRLPDPNRPEEFEGIIHLHGHVDKDYRRASSDGFVLSSSEFGDAYLADGWATRFIRAILEKYIVVFVGYAADDPPVHYLLEALNKRSNSLQKMFAFQVGSQNDAKARWGHKGVIPIAYDETEGHQSLWDTLAAWATRAVNPEAWYENIIDMARRGPEALQPHERGQVAHLVSSLEGARKFSGSVNPLPAEWLCVFDPAMRYLTPGNLGSHNEQGSFFDPFEAYGLESDPVPQKIDPEDYLAKRDVPTEVWSCFSPTSTDLYNLEIGNYAALRGHFSVNIPALPARLSSIGHWISMVSVQPATVWWAGQQAGLHPNIQEGIFHEIEKALSSKVRHAWRLIFAVWKMKKSDSYHEWFRLKTVIDVDGWSSEVVREFSKIYRPYLTMTRPSQRGPKPPLLLDGININNMVSFDVQYPTLHGERIRIPDEHLVDAIREFRKNLELSINLEKELGSYEYLSLPPIESDPDLEGDSSDRDYGMSRLFSKFLGLLKRLLVIDPVAAKKEFQAWWDDDDKVFALLRIWGAGQKCVFTNSEAGKLICSLTDEAFWDAHHQRDLLLVLASRWNDFPLMVRKKIERMLLAGNVESEYGDEKSICLERRAWKSLVRIHWLHEGGCCFSFDIEKETERLHKLAPRWQKQNVSGAVTSLESRYGAVHTDTGYSVLLTEPLVTLIEKAETLSGRTADWFLQKDPFQGLSNARPVRALSALRNSAKGGKYPEWAWRTFLFSTTREKDKPSLSALIAERLSRLPADAMAEFVYPASDWLQKRSKILFAEYPIQFEHIWSKLISVLNLDTDKSKTSLRRGNKEPLWVTEALNSPAGKLAQVVMNDPIIEGLKAGNKFSASWTNRIEELLGLPGDHRQYSLVMFTHNLNWFYSIDPGWTEDILLPALNSDNEDQAAFWDGFFWGGKQLSEPLLLRLKPHLLALSRAANGNKKRLDEVLSAILLAGWGSKSVETEERLITSEEMRNIILHSTDGFRGQIVWYLGRWARNEAKGAWTKNLPVFFTEAWPRQKQAKSPKISAKLCDLAFTSKATFAAIAEIVLPLVTKVDEEGVFLPHLRKTKDEIVGRYPDKTLTLLWAILPVNAAKWPYGVEEILAMLGEVKPSLLKNKNLVELKRRWNAR